MHVEENPDSWLTPFVAGRPVAMGVIERRGVPEGTTAGSATIRLGSGQATAASELFAPVRILKDGDFETLRLLTNHQGRRVPTVGGMLMFGKNRSRHFPDAWIQAGRFRGPDKAGIVDRAEIRLHLPSSVEAAVAFVERHSLRGAEIGAVRRKDRWSLPPAAVREAIVNAVAHADYSQRGAPIRFSIFEDRLEVENPGMLLFGLTVDDPRRGVSKLRNRVIGRVFHEIGFVEQWGSGIQRMIAACREAGLPAPTFEEIGCRFRVTLGTDRLSEPVLDRTDDAIMQCLADEKGWSTAELASAIGLTPRSTRSRMARLTGLGLVHEIGTAPQDPQRRYFRARQR